MAETLPTRRDSEPKLRSRRADSNRRPAVYEMPADASMTVRRGSRSVVLNLFRPASVPFRPSRTIEGYAGLGSGLGSGGHGVAAQHRLRSGSGDWPAALR